MYSPVITVIRCAIKISIRAATAASWTIETRATIVTVRHTVHVAIVGLLGDGINALVGTSRVALAASLGGAGIELVGDTVAVAVGTAVVVEVACEG